MKEEVQYYVKEISPNCVQVSKEVDGEVTTHYRVVGSDCQCWQAIRKKDCRHTKMVRKFREMGSKPLIVDFEKDVYIVIGDLSV